MEGFVQGKSRDGGPIHQERVQIILTAKSQQYHDVAEEEQYFVTVFFIVYHPCMNSGLSGSRWSVCFCGKSR